MNKFKNENGVTLIELLLSVAIFSIISAVVVGVMVNLFRHHFFMTQQVAIRQEADIVMTTFMNEIYTAEDVIETSYDEIVEVIQGDEKKYLGFMDGEAVVSGLLPIDSNDVSQANSINSERFRFSDDETHRFSSIRIEENTVFIDLHVFSGEDLSVHQMQLESRINFITRKE